MQTCGQQIEDYLKLLNLADSIGAPAWADATRRLAIRFALVSRKPATAFLR